jgi:uncharacterized membrane protein YphA (DoxX/SURF4 family)
MSIPALGALLVGAAFVVSGVAKLARPDLWRAQAADLGAPRFAITTLPSLELAVGALLVAQWQRSLMASVAAALLAAFTALLSVRIAQGRRPPCACFGSLSARPIGWQHLVRNGLLLGAAAVAALC